MSAAEAARALRREAARLQQQGSPQEALQILERALALHADVAIILTERGNVLQSIGLFSDAVANYDTALLHQPGLLAALINRSNALRAMGRLADALEAIETALRARPEFPEALNNRGNVLRDLGDLPAALASFDAALTLKPDFLLAHCNRGQTLLDLKCPTDALASFEVVLRDAPEDPEALFGRGSSLLQLHERLEQAAADFTRAGELGIERVETLVGKASALAQLQRHGEAAECLSEVLALAPDRAYARGSFMFSRLQACQWQDLVPLTERLLALVRAGARATHPMSLLSLTDAPELQLACARSFVRDLFPGNLALGPCRFRALDRDPNHDGDDDRDGRRLRVAYVSADFRDHPVSHLLVGVLERHDRRHFEVFGISLRRPQNTPFEQRVRAAFDRFIDVGERSDREIAQLLRELQIDIAVDLMGLTDGLRLGVFAHRAAPVQVSYLGYAGTSGAPYMDFILADEIVIPSAQERHYSERVVRLPNCYLPNDDRRGVGLVPTRAEAGLPPTGLVFCAFTNAYKINPPMFDLWMRLLRAVPDSVLWLRTLTGEARENLRREAQARSVEPDRLVFALRVESMAEHLARHSLADLYLDTLPYNAHSTACDALWAGVPVLTCAGTGFASRVAASALTAVGLPELVTSSLEEYERVALDLARRPERLRELRSRLARHRSRAPLFDTSGYCSHLETAYRWMAQQATQVPAGEPEAVT
jgi:predicted O-linked N-acetylglucosamine transferase (SPINDLY family)